LKPSAREWSRPVPRLCSLCSHWLFGRRLIPKIAEGGVVFGGCSLAFRFVKNRSEIVGASLTTRAATRLQLLTDARHLIHCPSLLVPFVHLESNSTWLNQARKKIFRKSEFRSPERIRDVENTQTGQARLGFLEFRDLDTMDFEPFGFQQIG